MADNTQKNPTLLLSIFLYTGPGSEEALRHVTLTENPGPKSLAELRLLLTQDKQFTNAQARYPFCTHDGGSVPEKTLFSVYSDMLKGSSSDDDSSESTLRTLKVLLKKETIFTGVDANIEKFLGDKLNLEAKENKVALLDTPLTQLESSYKHSKYAAAAGKGGEVHPADMTEQNWDVVMRTNNVLSGQLIITENFGKNKRQLTTVERGVYTAFELEQRNFEPYQISYSTHEKIGNTQSLKIPRFRVVDDSSVDVYETKSSIATALAKSSFSESVVEASAGGGIFGVSIGAKAGYSESDESASAISSKEDRSVMNISYNFPRVVLHLNTKSLKLSQECRDALPLVKNEDDVRDFYSKFGSFFAQRVELGGRLRSQQESSEVAGSSVSQKTQAMKAAASASISSSFAQASVSASHETQSAQSGSLQKSGLQSSITWEAQGGDTLLCNNPAAWCSTVASFYNWRVIKQDDICPIVEMIGKMKDYSWVPRQFAKASKVRSRLRFRLKANHKYGEGIEGCLGLATDGNREPVSVAYEASSPSQRRRAYIINQILELSPVGRMIPAANDGDYFEVYDVDFQEIDSRYLEYEKKYRLYNVHYKLWLSATENFSPFTNQRFLYGGNIDEAGLFHLETPGENKKKGEIKDKDSVQLILFDEDNTEVGIATSLTVENWREYVGALPYTEKRFPYIAYCDLEYGP